eukprot:TRINITY_DN2138_c0_g1_i1.p1 TRINITY_DN2138_c0_g1~~TRINITY_DN2138_c0_g1_i1.p1  ORF type:complete len:124 (+),score=21.48 TRINITY_DN2138_c0_g1_i1:74-445(+)
MLRSLVGSEMCIRDRYQRRVRGSTILQTTQNSGPRGRWTPSARRISYYSVCKRCFLKLSSLTSINNNTHTTHTHNPTPACRSLCTCLLYTSDAADEEDSVDLGGRRIIKKKKNKNRGTRCKIS